MSDEAGSTTGTSAPEAAPQAEPTPVAAPAPQTGPTAPQQPPKTVPTATTQPDLDGDMMVEVADANGQLVQLPLREMADGWRNTQSRPQVDPEKMKMLLTYDKALKGDAEAIREIIDTNLPEKQPDKQENPEFVEMRQQIQQLQRQLGMVAPTVAQIEQAKQQGAIKKAVELNAKQLPYLAKHPNSAALVHARLQQAEQYVRAATGQDLGSHERANDVRAWVFRGVENELKTLAETYKGFDPQATASASTKQVVDDQAANKPPPTYKAPLVQIGPDGRAIFNNQANNQAQPTVPEIPQAAVVPAQAAAGPSEAAGAPQAQGPYNTMQMRERMQTKIQEMTCGE